MATVYVDIQPSIINWVVKQLDGKIINDNLMNNIQHWLTGTKKPTFRQIEDLSKKSNIPLGYFFLQNPVEEKVRMIEYRTCDSIQLENPSRELIDTIQQMEKVQDWMKEYRQDEGFDKNNYVASLKVSDSKNHIVEQIRKDLGLDIDWCTKCNDPRDAFNKIRELLVECNILVLMNGCVGQNTHRPLSLKEFRAFAMIDEFAPLIFINAKDTLTGRLFSLLHEAVHIWLGENDLFNSFNSGEKPVEVICNAVTAEIIVPNVVFLKCWKLDYGNSFHEKIQNIAKKFCCSDIVIARKALDNHKISQQEYDHIVRLTFECFQKSIEKKVSGGNFYNTLSSKLDKGLIKALLASINSGRTAYTEAYRLTDTNSKTFAEITKN